MDSYKKQMNRDDFICQFPIDKKCDRDGEVPVLIQYIEDKEPIKSLLDVGCAHSHLSYAEKIRPFIDDYEGIDIVESPETNKILDGYYIGNVIDYCLGGRYFDMVTCVSVIEHSGFSTYNAFFRRERYLLFERLLELSKKYIWFSFHAGLEYVACNNDGKPDFCAVTKQDLEYFEDLAKAKGWNFKERFFYTQGAQADHHWYEHKDRDLALKVPYMDFIGNQSIGVMELTKKGVD